MNYWEIVVPARAPSFAGTAALTISAKPVGVGAVCQPLDSRGHTFWIADAHCDDGKRFVVRADEKLTAFLKPESGKVLQKY
jgi:hypothetical protein